MGTGDYVMIDAFATKVCVLAVFLPVWQWCGTVGCCVPRSIAGPTSVVIVACACACACVCVCVCCEGEGEKARKGKDIAV